MLQEYYRLVKPGIVYGNMLPAIAGYVFGTGGAVNLATLLYMTGGLMGIIACGCVLNNILDRSVDARMERTRMRALAQGSVTPRAAFLFAFVLGVVGALLLAETTAAAASSALFGLFVYAAVYSPLKPHNSAALFVGAVAGAVPPVVGYTAATGALDWYALALFGALYLWQLPHFVAIAYFRFDEYAVAGVPLIVRTPPSERARARARTVFGYSLWVLLIGCVGLMLQTWVR